MTDSPFYVAPDADNEPCVWRAGTFTEDQLVLRRCDLRLTSAWDVLTGHLEVRR